MLFDLAMDELVERAIVDTLGVAQRIGGADGKAFELAARAASMDTTALSGEVVVGALVARRFLTEARGDHQR